MKNEVRRLEQGGGGKAIASKAVAGEAPDVAKLRAENGRLRNQIKCLEIEVEQKDDKLKKLLTSCLGVPDEQLEEKELRIAELEERVEQLEKENFKVKQEAKLGRGVTEPTPQLRSKDESERVIADLSKQNAGLRRKLDDALEKLGSKK